MTETTQSYDNHRRVFPLYHLFALPVLLAHVIVTVVGAVREPSAWTVWMVVVALGLAAAAVANRTSTLIVQNRVIGLEMRLRLATVLPVELCQRIPELHLRQLVGLRYAGDAELPGLVERCLRGELATADAVKRAVRQWRPNYARAGALRPSHFTTLVVIERILSAWGWVVAVSLVLLGFFYVGAVWLVTAPFDRGRYHAGRAFRQLAV